MTGTYAVTLFFSMLSKKIDDIGLRFQITGSKMKFFRKFVRYLCAGEDLIKRDSFSEVIRKLLLG